MQKDHERLLVVVKVEVEEIGLCKFGGREMFVF